MNNTSNQKIEELFSQFEVHPSCVEEIFNLVVEKRILKDFFKAFQRNAEQLRVLGRDAIKTNNFEKLKGAPDLYSMRLKNARMNLRILFTYKDGVLALLLCCFYERSDSSEKYNKYISTALKRKEEMEA